MFDPRSDDARDRDGREAGRERVYEERDRDDHDPRDGLMRDLDLPRGEERELAVERDRAYELNVEESRTLAVVGAFRVVPEHDLESTRRPSTILAFRRTHSAARIRPLGAGVARLQAAASAAVLSGRRGRA